MFKVALSRIKRCRAT